MRIGIKEVTNPLEVLECLVAFDSRDYGTAKRDRMLYAIILGWDDASYKSFGWSEEEIKEWKQMRERFERLKEVDICTADVVPKSEVESIITLNSQLEAQVFEQRKEIERLTINMNAYGLAVKRLAEERTEIFEKVEKIILDNTYPDFNREHKPVNIWKAKDGYDAFYELKKKYTECSEGEQ